MPEGIGYDTPALRLKKRMKKAKPSLNQLRGQPAQKPNFLDRFTSTTGQAVDTIKGRSKRIKPGTTVTSARG